MSRICNAGNVVRLFLAMACALCAPLAAAELIWIEGESASASTMKKHPWYSDSVNKSELSGGNALSNFGPGAAPEATFSFKADTAGEYNFWARMNPVAGPTADYDLNGAGWKAVDFSRPTDNRNVAADAKPDMRFLAWLNLGKVQLKQGENTIKFRFTSANSRHGSLDCFFFSQESLTPSGKLKPGEKLGLAEPNMWAFEPDADTFSPKALLDLRSLNTPIQKNDPFVQIDKNGDFTKANAPLRFWAVNCYTQKGATPADLKKHGQWLAKRGVNLVRWHGHLPTDAEAAPSALEDINKRELDECFKLVAAMRENGIYSCLSPYWGTATANKKSWGLGHIQTENLAAVVFWDKRVQAAYKGYLKAMMTTPNPYSGIALKDDPAVAIVQLQNEDSMLFWTMSAVKGAVLEDLKALFGTYAVKKYGSIDKAYAAWDNSRLKDDDVASGKLGLENTWELTQVRTGGKEARKSDQFAFFCKLMRDFNEDMENYLRKELGCKQVVNAGNWRTADDSRMLDGERYSYAGNGVIGVNRYKSVTHTGPRAGYLISPGDTYSATSALLDPSDLPVAVKQVTGKAMIIPESNWVPPLKYRSEGPLLTAAYSSLSGVDCLIWFCEGAKEWEHPFGKWSISTPMQLGQFPAAALLFRMGYVTRAAQPAVAEVRPLEEVWKRTQPAIWEGQAYDPNRDAEAPASGATAARSKIDPLAFLVGPVEIRYDGHAEDTKVADLTKYIDPKAKTVTSLTSQLKLDYGKGVFTLNTPKAQAAAGWLAKEAAIELADITLTAKNDYATIIVVSLDDKPLKSSAKVLVQIGTVERPYGFREEKTKIAQKGKPELDGFKITDLGSSLWNIEKAEAELVIRNNSLTRATILDANGMPLRTENLNGTAKGRTLKLPADALYVVLQN